MTNAYVKNRYALMQDMAEPDTASVITINIPPSSDPTTITVPASKTVTVVTISEQNLESVHPTVGDRVWWTGSFGGRLTGEVVRLNKKKGTACIKHDTIGYLNRCLEDCHRCN